MRNRGELLVTMNRDEQRSRAPEEPPRVHAKSSGGPNWMAPVDGQTGGTWMGVNDRGVVACILNNYLAPEPASAHRSRGEIVPELLARGGSDEPQDWIANEFDVPVFRPFTLVIVSLQGGWGANWEGTGDLKRTAVKPGWSMFTSSSWNTVDVLRWRREAFDRWLENADLFAGDLPSFHLFQPSGMAEWAPLMAREKTHTRSITQVRVDGWDARAEMRYWLNPSPAATEPSSMASMVLRSEHGKRPEPTGNA